jgi:hypothetical protein
VTGRDAPSPKTKHRRNLALIEPGCDGPQVENNSTLNRISEHTALKGRKRADVPVYLWVLAFITPDRFSGLQGIELIQPQPTRSRFCSDRSRKGLRSVGSSCGPFSPLADHDELAIQFPSVTRATDTALSVPTNPHGILYRECACENAIVAHP